jgi:tripartite-type tricarboxylate transporter receptor subunit TctC
MLRGSFVPAGTPQEAVDALRAAWRAMPGDQAFVGDYKKAFKADPKILQANVAQAHIDRVKSIDPKVVSFLKSFIKGGK